MIPPFLIHGYLARTSEIFPNKEALIFGNTRLTYREISDLSDALAACLRSRGLRRGDRVAVFMDNAWETVVSIYGILKAGGVFISLNGGLKSGKLKYILDDSGARALIAQAGKSLVVAEALSTVSAVETVIWAGSKDRVPGSNPRNGTAVDWEEALSLTGPDFRCKGSPPFHPGTIDLDLAALIYTSGSTGEPKGVMSTHRNMIAAALSIIRYLENTDQDVIMNALPLSFDYGLYQVLMAVMVGATVVLEQSFAFPVKVLEKMERERVTGFPLVPTMAALLLSLKDLGRYDLFSLRYVTNTAAALPVDHVRRLGALWPRAKIFSMYGLTECKRVAYLPPEELGRRPASVGKAIPNCEVLVVGEDGRELPPGEVGELTVRGSNVMAGYWRSPELTAQTFRAGPFPGERILYSGDLFKKDADGFLFFVGRKDDLIKTRGERVSPREVENALCRIPGVFEAAVVGTPDPILGEAVSAYVVLHEGSSLNEREILKHCSRELEALMVPKYVSIVESLPKTPHGKVDRKALRS